MIKNVTSYVSVLPMLFNSNYVLNEKNQAPKNCFNFGSYTFSVAGLMGDEFQQADCALVCCNDQNY